MPDVLYYLKPADKQGNRLIQMDIRYGGNKRFKYSFGCKLSKADNWEGKDSRIERIKGDAEKNKMLRDFTEAFETSWKELSLSGMPSPDQLRDKMNAYKEGRESAKAVQPDKTGKKTFKDVFIEVCAKKKAGETINNREAVMNRIYGTIEKPNGRWPNLDFKDITPSWLEEYREWLTDENPEIETTSINAYLSIIKMVVKEAIRKKYMRENPFDDFEMETPDEGDSDDVALTKAELKILVNWKKADGKPLPELTKALQGSLDWFLIGCFTGLRSKDLKGLSMANITDGQTLKVKTSKKGRLFEMPVPYVVQQIIKKYNGFPKPLSASQFNVNIKKICELAGFNETGVLSTDLSKPLWQCIQRHSSRRTFITIKLYEDKVPAATVMKWTTHKTESMLWAYAKPRVKESSKIAMELDKEWI